MPWRVHVTSLYNDWYRLKAQEDKGAAPFSPMLVYHPLNASVKGHIGLSLRGVHMQLSVPPATILDALINQNEPGSPPPPELRPGVAHLSGFTPRGLQRIRLDLSLLLLPSGRQHSTKNPS